jgi:hypothetical protein
MLAAVFSCSLCTAQGYVCVNLLLKFYMSRCLQVTKNIGVLQLEGSAQSSSSKGSIAAQSGGHISRSATKAAAAGPPSGWYLPSWVVFTAVSVVMAVLVCVMAVRLYARVRERQVNSAVGVCACRYSANSMDWS